MNKEKGNSMSSIIPLQLKWLESCYFYLFRYRNAWWSCSSTSFCHANILIDYLIIIIHAASASNSWFISSSLSSKMTSHLRKLGWFVEDSSLAHILSVIATLFCVSVTRCTPTEGKKINAMWCSYSSTPRCKRKCFWNLQLSIKLQIAQWNWMHEV